MECESCKILQKRVDSLGDGIKELNKKIETLEYINSILESEKVQWIQEKTIQQQIIHQQLGNSDNVISQLQDEIRELRRKIKKIKKEYNIVE